VFCKKTRKPERFLPRLILIGGLVILSPNLGPDYLMATEEPKYQVLERSGDFELRLYQPYIEAETLVEGDFNEVGNEGFRRLFDYIQGKNRKKQDIPMAAPVTQEAASEKIPMTAPVGQEKTAGKWRITFVMPSSYTMSTLPEPLDPRITLVEIPGRLMAVHRYSGTWDKERYEAKEHELREFIKEKGLKIAGETLWARYNPPFAPWFLRRNEVMIPVAPAQ
jgi:effector-binding domain-containing protein